MSTPSSDIVILFIDITEEPLARLLSGVRRELARMHDDLFSVYIITDTDDLQASSIVETITLHAVIGLLEAHIHRIDELVIQTEYLSSLSGVWGLVNSLSPSLADGLAMYYVEDDL